MQNPSIFKYLYRYAARFPTNQPAKIDKFTPKQTQNDGGQAGNQRPEPYRVVMWWIASVCSRPRGQSPTRRALHRTHKATSDTSPEIALCRGICEHTCASACAVCVCVCVCVRTVLVGSSGQSGGEQGVALGGGRQPQRARHSVIVTVIPSGASGRHVGRLRAGNLSGMFLGESSGGEECRHAGIRRP